MSNTYLRCCDLKIKGIWMHCPRCGRYLMSGDSRFKQMKDIGCDNAEYELVVSLPETPEPSKEQK